MHDEEKKPGTIEGRKERGEESGRRELPYRIRLLKYNVPVYTGAGTGYAALGSINRSGQHQIVEEREGRGASLWGRLKSGVGWIPLDDTEVICGDGKVRQTGAP